MSCYTFTHGIIPISLLLLLTTPYSVFAQSPTAGSRDEPYGTGYARVTPSMAIIIVVLIAALFFMGFFSIYIRHCNDTNGGSVRPLGIGGRSRRAAVARGIDPAVIEAFPTLEYSMVKGLKIGKGALECAVCLNEFEDDETLRLLPKCDHVFHPECIDAWLASHTTCPVCRADLTPQAGDPVSQLSELHPDSPDLEAQNQSSMVEPEPETVAPDPEVMSVNQTLNRNRTRGSRSGLPRKFPRSHSTGHSLVQPGENTDRFTLRLPIEVRKQMLEPKLNRAASMLALPRVGSSRRGYRTGGEGSSRGKVFNYLRLERLDQEGGKSKSDRWIFGRTPSFLARASSFLSRTTSVKTPKVVASDGEGASTRPAGSDAEPIRPPV